jgi:hypothetical protein
VVKKQTETAASFLLICFQPDRKRIFLNVVTQTISRASKTASRAVGILKLAFSANFANFWRFCQKTML